jgi:hypothetical protein
MVLVICRMKVVGRIARMLLRRDNKIDLSSREAGGFSHCKTQMAIGATASCEVNFARIGVKFVGGSAKTRR